MGCAAPPAASPPATEDAPQDAAVTALFDGETLAGWDGNPDFFRVEGGAVVAGRLSEEIPRNEFLCTTQEFGDFELRLEALTSREDANGGIQFRSHREEEGSEVVGYQADVGVQDDGRNIWGALYDESRRRKFLAVADQEGLEGAFESQAWNAYAIRAEGAHIQTWINGHQTVDYTEPDPEIATAGLICLQIHSGPPAEIRYRGLEIQRLGAGAE